jgi:methylated-DNA-[protein]-cysteine S-methyltransferase
MTLYADTFATPPDRMFVAVDERGAVVELDFENGRPAARQAARLAASTGQEVVWDAEACRAVRAQVEEYMAGARRDFDLPTAARGTEFQQAVWAELRRVPYGATASYGEIAERIGVPGAARAVGAANGANPISLVVPCHRIVGSDGSLTGYGGGMRVKEYLLALEARVSGEQMELRLSA